MNLLDYTTTWVKGEILQGKILLIIGLIFLITAIVIFKSDNALLKGTLIPMAFMLLIFFGYGGMQVFSRTSHINKVEEIYKSNQKEAIDMEYTKAKKDDKSYSILKPIWAILIVLSIVLYFAFSSYYMKGLSIGLVGLFLTALIVDSTLHYRLLTYYEALKQLAS